MQLLPVTVIIMYIYPALFQFRKCFSTWFIHSASLHWAPFSVPNSVLGAEGLTVNKTKALLLWSLYFNAGKTDNKQEPSLDYWRDSKAAIVAAGIDWTRVRDALISWGRIKTDANWGESQGPDPRPDLAPHPESCSYHSPTLCFWSFFGTKNQVILPAFY